MSATRTAILACSALGIAPGTGAWLAAIRQAHRLSDKELRERALGGCKACAAVDKLRSTVFRRKHG